MGRILVRRHHPDDEAFRRQLTFAEEDRHKFTTAPWSGGYRWFRSPNVVPIEYWQRLKVEPPAGKKPRGLATEPF